MIDYKEKILKKFIWNIPKFRSLERNLNVKTFKVHTLRDFMLKFVIQKEAPCF